MTLKTVVGVVGLLLALPGSRALSQEPYPVPVFVTTLETPQLPRLRPEQYEAAISAAKEHMYAVAAELRKEHGDNTKKWPPAVWKEFYVAEDAYRLAIARRDYQDPDTRLLIADSVADFARNLKPKTITLASSAEEAYLLVQITARRRIEPPGVTDNRYFIRFRLAPGGKMTPERLDELTTGSKWDALASKIIAHCTPATPYLDLEGASMASWKDAAGTVRLIVEGFVRERMDPRKQGR